MPSRRRALRRISSFRASRSAEVTSICSRPPLARCTTPFMRVGIERATSMSSGICRRRSLNTCRTLSRSRIHSRRMGLAVCQISSSGYRSRPNPSTFSRVFCSRMSCGCTSMLKRREISNSRTRMLPKDTSFNGRLKIGSSTVRTADSISSTRVLAGTQPDSTCRSATRR